MSYDLYFWRQTSGLQMQPEQVFRQFSVDMPVDGIATFPRSLVRKVFQGAFPDIVDGDTTLEWEGAGSYFQVSFGHATDRDVHLITVNCGYPLLQCENIMNRIIDACCSLGCALYDPQSEERYDQPDPDPELASEIGES